MKTYTLFFFDALGAFISILCLLASYQFHARIGMPRDVLIVFIAIASTLFTYSSICYLLKPQRWQLHLTQIAVLNLSYCGFTIFKLVENSDRMTNFGYFYFCSEIAAIVFIACYELMRASKKQR